MELIKHTVGPSFAAVHTIDCDTGFGFLPVKHPVPLRLTGSGTG